MLYITDMDVLRCGTCRMAKTPKPPNPTKGGSLGKVEAPDEAAALEKAAGGIQGAG
jgi:hypothetical protein